ncbi:MAG: dynamin family protein [Prevotellaceae bacterium]|nr:dynamin family protein [Prevotellaceae bacterium]
MEGFGQNNIWRLRLARYFQKALGCAELSPVYLESVQLQSLFKQFEEGVTSVCVIGDFKVGKTSFINALLGESILPTDDIPCTGNIPHRVKYGTNPKAMLYFQSPFPMDYRETLSSDVTDYLKWNNYGRTLYGNDIQIPALEYPFIDSFSFIKRPEIPESILFSGDDSELGEYLSQYNNSKSAFNSVELYYPSEFLKKRIAIADIAIHELGADVLNTRMIIESLNKADFVLYVSDSGHPFTYCEEEMIEILLNLNSIELSGIIANRIDLCGDHDNRGKICTYIQVRTKEYFPANAVFCVSSKEALDAYKENNDELLLQSGIPKVKEFIERLAVGKERKRFIASSNALKDVICNSMIPSIKSEITKTFGEHRVEKMGNLIFISTELQSVVVGLDKLIDEIETQTSNETK